MPFIFRSMFAINNINNGTLSSQKAMPQKDLSSTNEGEFAMDRRNYTETVNSGLSHKTNLNYPQKKWLGNRDASQVTYNRRVSNIGTGSLNADGVPMSFTTVKDVNTVNDALRRARAGGSVAPPKVRARRTNAPTPSWATGPLIRSQYQSIHPIENKTAMINKPISANIPKRYH